MVITGTAYATSTACKYVQPNNTGSTKCASQTLWTTPHEMARSPTGPVGEVNEGLRRTGAGQAKPYLGEFGLGEGPGSGGLGCGDVQPGCAPRACRRSTTRSIGEMELSVLLIGEMELSVLSSLFQSMCAG